MLPVLLVLFIAVPIAELYVIVRVGDAIGVLPTLALLVVASFLGAALARSQGRAVWERFNRALAAGRVPGREVFDGAMVILGGALLLTPGFLTDVVGLLLLLPPTRALARRGLAALVLRRGAVRIGTQAYGTWRTRGESSPARGYDYEGSAREVPPGELPPTPPDGAR